jgi:hydrogenase-4 membrane subunit HyfE
MKNINKIKLAQFIMSIAIAICTFILTCLHFYEREIIWGILFLALACSWSWISYLDFKDIKS